MPLGERLDVQKLGAEFDLFGVVTPLIPSQEPVHLLDVVATLSTEESVI